MGILDNVLKLFVGDKSKKDISDIQPIVAQIKKQESVIEELSIDQLRAKTTEFKNKIKADQKEIQDQINALEKESSEIDDINKKEDLYKEIDQLKDDKYLTEVKTLEELLPEAFAVMKETAKRFTNNDTRIKILALLFINAAFSLLLLQSNNLMIFIIGLFFLGISLLVLTRISLPEETFVVLL